MMGIVMIDVSPARLDGLVETAYYRRMTLASDLPKAGTTSREPKRALSIDPSLRMGLPVAFLIDSSLFYRRPVVICIQNSQRFRISKIRADLRAMANTSYQGNCRRRRDN